MRAGMATREGLYEALDRFRDALRALLDQGATKLTGAEVQALGDVRILRRAVDAEDDVALADLAPAQAFDGLVLALVDPRGSLEPIPVLRNRGELNDRPVRG